MSVHSPNLGGCSTLERMPVHAKKPLILVACLVLGLAAWTFAPAVQTPVAGAAVGRTALAGLGEGGVAFVTASSHDDLPGTVILGRPTDVSATLSLLTSTTVQVSAEYGLEEGSYPAQTSTVTVGGTKPTDIDLTGLTKNTEYHYRLRFRQAGDSIDRVTKGHTFHTQRPVGDAFSFAVESDSHMGDEDRIDPDLMRQSLREVRDADPDFLIDLGDTFVTDTGTGTEARVEQRYRRVRSYFGIAGVTVPLFLTPGNHDAELGWLRDGTDDNLAVWAARARNLYYPAPLSDGFYSVDSLPDPFAGLRSGYYAWEWGDALFVVIDPWWQTLSNPEDSGDWWDSTLGDRQYEWLSRVLRASSARYKFVLSHHILGRSRGGIELVGSYEWGGKGKGDVWQFHEERPGWELPIHQLFVETGVTIFFQGHDHLYARQEKDGVIYQTVPQPGAILTDADRERRESAYKSGKILPGPGFLEVRVSDDGVKVDYVRSWLDGKDGAGFENNSVVYTYTVRGTTDDTTPTEPPSPAFTDMRGPHPYRMAIEALAGLGVVGGFSDGTFRPDDPVVRQQFAKMAVLTARYPVSEQDVCSFPDVKPGGSADFYPDNYVAVAAAHGVTLGYPDGTFRPYSEITLAQALAMAERVASDLTPGGPPADIRVRLLQGVEGDPDERLFSAASRGVSAQVLWNLRSLVSTQ